MAQFCIACDRKLNLIANNENEHVNVICECGVINQVDYTQAPKRQLNVALIRSKMRDILSEKHFSNIDETIKKEIELHSSKIGTHVINSLKCFAIIYIESKNLVCSVDDFIINKRQRRSAIQILVSINIDRPTIFIRTPLTYIKLYENIYTDEEKQTYINVSECLLFLNACNKKNMQIFYDKIHNTIIEMRQIKKIHIKVSNLSNLIRFIAYTGLNVNDLLKAEEKLIRN